MFVATGVQSVKSSWEENRKNKSSCVEAVPIVVSVPNKKTCLSGIETRLNRELVGACVITAALVDVPDDVSQRKVLPLCTVAIKSSPNVSKDQLRPSIVTVDVDLGVFQASTFHASVPQP